MLVDVWKMLPGVAVKAIIAFKRLFSRHMNIQEMGRY